MGLSHRECRTVLCGSTWSINLGFTTSIVASDISEALHSLHLKGIAHADLKPENVLLDGDKSQVYLIDFSGPRIDGKQVRHGRV
jgi:serine/threonine protein kinase